jgi:hypothetical protein
MAAACLDVIAADHQVQGIRLGIAAQMQLAPRRGEGRAIAVAAGGRRGIQIEAQQTMRPSAMALARSEPGQEFQQMIFAAAIGPAQGLVARRFIDILAAAIGEAVQREILGAPAERAMRALALDP